MLPIYLLIAFLDANLCVARAVNKEDSKLPDVEAHIVKETVYLDVYGTHLFAKSYRSSTTCPVLSRVLTSKPTNMPLGLATVVHVLLPLSWTPSVV